MTLEKIKQKAARLSNSEEKKRDKKPGEEIEELTTEFKEVRKRLLKGEDYIDQYPGHEEAVEEFKELLKRTAEINSKLMELGEKPKGIEK